MLQPKERFIVDKNGQRLGVLLDIEDYQRLLEELEELEAIRAQYGFKTPDAVYLAAAVISGCDVSLTNDHRLDRFSDIAVEVTQP